MTHILIALGSGSGGPPPKTLTLGFFQNQPTFNNVVLSYTVVTLGTVDRHTNVSTFNALVLQSVPVTQLTLTQHANASTFFDLSLSLLPFVPVNAETTALLAECTGSYSTTNKIQIDTLITNLKTAGVWALLDWYNAGRFMANTHDSLIDWTQPTRSLVVVLSPTFTPFVGWQGMPSINASRLKSGWQPTDGPHSTATSFTFFIHIESANAENNAQAGGNWERSSGGGPTAPKGTFITAHVVAGTFDAGANVNPFDGIPGAALGAFPATLAITYNGATQQAFRNGASAGTDAAATHFERTHADGLCILGTPPGLSAGRAFNGLISYAGWGAFMTGTQLAAIDDAVTNALLPPGTGATTDSALFVDGSDNWLVVDGSDNYLKVI